MSQSGALLLLLLVAAHNQQVKAEKAETTCLAQALYYEARGEGERGQKAVAEVILHRVQSPRHPKTICGVVHEPYQFSFLYDGSTKRPLDPKAWKASYELAARIRRGEVVSALTQRALFFHEVSIRPKWAAVMVRTVRIGNHIFYRHRERRPQFAGARLAAR